MATITVLGAGMMGSALCVPLVDRHHHVRLVGTHLDDAIIASLQKNRYHPTLGYELPGAVQPFQLAALPVAMADTDVIALGVSSAGLAWAAQQVAPFCRADRPLLMITKGMAFDGQRLRVPTEIVAQLVSDHAGLDLAPAAITGPCIAGELARRVPSCVLVAGRKRTMLDHLVALLTTEYYHLWPWEDAVGAQVCGALKNAYAMAVAFGAGRHARSGADPGSVAHHNYESAIFAQAIVEMGRLVRALGGNIDTVMGLAGVGDLDVTNNGGRTGRFGALLGRGLSVRQAVEQMAGATLECLEIIAVLNRALLRSASAPASEGGANLPAMPLLEHLAAVALDDQPVDVPFARFFASGRGAPG